MYPLLSAYLKEEIMIKEEPTDISESLQIKEETSSADAEIKHELQDTKQELQDAKQEPQDAKQQPQDTKQELQDAKQEPQDAKQEPQDTKQELQDTKQEPQDTKQEPQDAKQKPQDAKQELHQTKIEFQETKIELQDNSGTETDSDDKAEEFSRISAHPDFLCVAQFIGTFGGLLGIPQFFIDTIEDGLNSSNTDISDEYVKGNF